MLNNVEYVSICVKHGIPMDIYFPKENRARDSVFESTT